MIHLGSEKEQKKEKKIKSDQNCAHEWTTSLAILTHLKAIKAKKLDILKYQKGDPTRPP